MNGISLLESALRTMTPLLFAAMGGLLSERSGVINIALEGLMLAGAFTAAVVAAGTGWWPGFLAGAAAGMALAGLYGYLVLNLRSNQIVAGTGINLLAMGVPPVLSKIWYGNTTSTPAIEATLPSVPHAVVWILFAALVWWYHETRSGLWVRFAGEHPKALETSGVSVLKTRAWAVAAAGIFAGLGGATLSIGLASSYTRNMTAGRGFIALAALILGRWKPVPTAIACFVFGLADALQTQLQGVVLWGTEPVPVQFIQIIPYVVTLVVLAGAGGISRKTGQSGRSHAPKSLGIPWENA
jgi:simple sugar transport system permease protein